MYAYCLFCETMKCDAVAGHIQRKYGYRAISPRIVQRKWVKGVPHEETRPLLPGYVFVYADAPVEAPRAALRLENVLRLLGDPDAGYALAGDDLRFARMLLDCDGTVGILKVYREGDRVKLAPDALGGIEGEIIRLDRNKGRAEIRYYFAGTACHVWVGYEMIEGQPG